MRRYELMLLIRPDLEDDKLQSAVEKVTRAIVNGGGALTKVSPWGKRRMAYPIQTFRDASYFLIHFDIAPSAVREIERGLLISEEILRHLVVVIEDRGPLAEEDLAPAVPAASSEEADGREPEAAAASAQQPEPAGEASDSPAEESAPGAEETEPAAGLPMEADASEPAEPASEGDAGDAGEGGGEPEEAEAARA
ncbi:MAG TPA: 30S ribosomal protein S6 [Candidatus Limnocylindria bacterium]|nr:30S ribosomal protein S6 [Candidatus Limnocylindria bacterium]